MKKQAQAKAFIGWHLVAGLLIFTVMTLIVGAIGENVTNGEPLTLTDVRLNTWLQIHRSPSIVIALRAATELGSSWTAIPIALAFGLFLLWRRRPYWVAAIWLSVFGGMALNKLLKYAFHRPRPYINEPILSLTGYSFPSGHTMTATVLVTVLAAYFVAHTERLATRILVVLSASLLIALVGFSRMYLGAHYLSDVLGALAEGLAWLSLCLTLVYSVWRGRERKKGRTEVLHSSPPEKVCAGAQTKTDI